MCVAKGGFQQLLWLGLIPTVLSNQTKFQDVAFGFV